MVKKVLIGTLACGLTAGFLFGTDMFSYAETACDSVREVVTSEIPPEFEVKRIRKSIDKLMPEIRQHMTVVAEQSVDVKDMQRDITDLETRLAKQKNTIVAMREDLDSDRNKFTYRHVSYSRREMESDLADRFDTFRSGEDALSRQRQILEAQKQTLRANQKKLDTMLARKQKLIVQVEQMEARLKTIQATEAVHCIEVDDSALTAVEERIKNFNRQLDVRESLLETEGAVLGRIPVEEEMEAIDSPDVLTAIDRHFNLESDSEVAEVSHSSL